MSCENAKDTVCSLAQLYTVIFVQAYNVSLLVVCRSLLYKSTVRWLLVMSICTNILCVVLLLFLVMLLCVGYFAVEPVMRWFVTVLLLNG